jgi:hypothetical protein
MPKSQETLRPDTQELLMHERFRPWVSKHVLDYPGQIGDLGYDPIAHPSQRIDEFKTLPVVLRPEFGLSDQDALGTYWQLFEFNMGSESAARNFVKNFQDQPAFEGSNQTYSELVVDSIEQNKKVGLVCDHAEDLGDVVKASAALGLAITQKHGTKYIPAFNIWINKLMTRETYMGMPVDYLAGLVGNVRWAMPDTGSALDFGFGPKDELTGFINRGTLRGYIGDIKKGTVESLIPGGSGMTKNLTSAGYLESLSQKPTSAATAQLLGHMDVLIPVSVWKDTWQIGEARLLDDIKSLPKSQRAANVQQLVGTITASLAEYTSKLSGVPVQARGIGTTALNLSGISR